MSGVRADPPPQRVGHILRRRDFRHLWAADAVSQLGNRINILAMPLLAITVLNASTVEVSLLRTLETAAWLVLGMPVGAWCDRMRCRPVLIVADVGRAVVLGTVPIAFLFGVLTFWQLCCVAAITGILTVFFDVAHQTYLPRLIERGELLDGNAKLQANTSVAAVVAPSVSGFLVQWFGAAIAVLANALSFLWSACWLSTIRAKESRPVRAGRPRLMAEIGAGLRLVMSHPLLRVIGLTGALGSLFQSAHTAVSVVFLVRTLHLAPGAIGLLSSTALVGAVIAAFVVRPIAAKLGQARLMCLAALAYGVGFLVFPVTRPGVGLVCWAVAGFATSCAIVMLNVVQVSFQQAICPDELLGRMNATMKFLLWGTIPVGSALGGGLATVVGLRGTLWIAATGVLVSSVWLLLSPVRRLRDLPED
jgi:MFS family permease